MMAKRCYIAHDFNELCNTIDQIEKEVAQYADGLITQPTLWFRGQSDYRWAPVPSIQRFNRSTSESVLCHSFYHGVSQINSSYIPKAAYDQWLSMMQHYGLPTRLLDWSYSPLVALYFALDKYEIYKDVDASLTVLIPEFLNQAQGFEPYIFPLDSATAMEMLKSAFYTKSTSSNKILACFSTSNDLRQYTQRAGFTIHDSTKQISEICNTKSLYTILIPKEKKEYFKKALWSLGIREGYLFPDITHVAKDAINRHLHEKI